MPDAKIKIKAVKRAPSKIVIRRKLLSASDIKVLTQNILKLNSFSPLQQNTIQDFFDKSNEYMRRLQPNKNTLIKIKNIKLYRNAN